MKKVQYLIIICFCILCPLFGFSEQITFTLETNIVSGAAYPDDTLQVFLSLKNTTGKDITGDFYMIMIKPSGEILYFPGWTKTISNIPLTIPGNFEINHIEVPRMIFGNGNLTSFGEYTLACGFLTNSGWASNFGIVRFHHIQQDFFVPAGGKVRYRTGGEPQQASCADLDNDGNMDIVTSCMKDDYVSILLGKGDGTYKTQIIVFVGNAPLSPTIANINNDGLQDILVTTRPDWLNPDAKNEVAILTNLGNTIFSLKSYEVGIEPSQPLAGFIDDDGYPDIVTSNRGSNDISVLINKGDGTFLPQVNYSAGNSPNQLALTDVNYDGHPDICITNQGSSDLWILTNDGKGAFNDKQVYQVGEKPRVCTPAYFFVDEYPSLLVSYKDGIAVFHNKGDGTFYDKVDYPTQNKNPVQVQIHDANGDGYSDMLTSTNPGPWASCGISVFMNNGDGTFAPEVLYPLDIITEGNLVPDLDFIIGNNISSSTLPDIVVYNLGYRNCPKSNVVVLKNSGDGTFKVDKPYPVGDEPSFITMQDLNKDNSKDLIISNWGSDDISVLVNQGDGMFQGEYRIPFSDTINPLICTDISGDGIPDLIAARHLSLKLSVVINNGDGSFAPEILYQNTSKGFCNDMISVDLNNDGFNDILWATKYDSSYMGGTDSYGLSVFMNKGDGTLADEVYYQMNGSNLDSNHLISTDLDKDGFLDVVLSNKGTNNISVLINKGDGTFKDEITYSTGFSPDTLLTSDLNNDGYEEIITLNNYAATVGDNNLSVLINKKDGTFEQSTEYGVGSGPEIIKSADLNDDGWLDLIVGNYNSNDISFLINEGDGTFKTQEKIQTGSSQHAIEISDCNNDGFSDLLIPLGDSTQIQVLINQKDETFAISSIDVGYKIKGIVVGDIDKDGNIDIIGASYRETNQVFLLPGKGDGSFMTPIFCYSMGDYPYYIFLEDMNNDTLLDIVLGNMYSVDVAIHWNTGYSYY